MNDLHPPNVLLHIVATVVVCFCLAGTGYSADSAQNMKQKAKKYYLGIGGEQSYEKALELYLRAAEAGDPEAQYIAGGMYFKGLGTNKDFPKAFKLLLEAAKKGKKSAESEQILGQGFLLGSGVPKNYQKALEWYSSSAENGNREAQNELGFMYFVGNGVEQNLEKGADLFFRAAYNGLAVAQYNVGIMYLTGKGVKVTDMEKSYAWLNLAAASGHQPAKGARTYLESILAQSELQAAQNYSEELLKEISQLHLVPSQAPSSSRKTD
ncbi:MAG: sel1 repeat family protein [Desulforhopalus sp.]|nr:sel1 repeat family protein [Desulforhopalus sp.]